jgi:hypothetical protein
VTGRRALSVAARVLFYAYVVTLAVAGIWGTFGARLDFPLLLHQEVGDLDPEGASDVLSQYRFLRAVEAGFGVFALRFRREIFTDPTFNRLFLGWMGFGILARGVSIPLDGRPSAPMLVFLAVEVLGIVAVTVDTWPVVRGHRTAPP